MVSPATEIREPAAPPQPSLAKPTPPVAEPTPPVFEAQPDDPPVHEPLSNGASEWMAEGQDPADPSHAQSTTASESDPSEWLRGATVQRVEAPPQGVERQAIEAYCRELLDPVAAEAAVAEILRTASSTQAHGDGLLQLARRTVAGHLSPAAGRRGLRGLLSAEHNPDCRATPGRLAERSAGELAAADERLLEEHLELCLPCRALSLRSARANRAALATLALGGIVTDEDAAAGELTRPLAPASAEAHRSPGPPPASVDRKRTGSGRRLALLAFAALLLGGVATAVALVGNSGTKTAPSIHAHAATTAATTAAATPARSPSAVVHRHRGPVHHRPIHHPRSHKRASPQARAQPHSSTQPASPAGAQAPSNSSSSPGSSPVAPSPVTTTPAPAAPAPAAPAPTQSSGSSGSAGAGAPTVSIQQPNLPAQSAPTQGIGGGRSPDLGH